MDYRLAADELEALGRRLKAAGETELRRELFKAMQRAAQPAKKAAKDAARKSLPHEGGLAEKIAGSKFTTKVSAGRNAGVTITAASPIDLKALDRGRLRKPLFGNRSYWYTQPVPAGWFTDAMTIVADKQVRPELVAALEAIIKKL